MGISMLMEVFVGVVCFGLSQVGGGICRVGIYWVNPGEIVSMGISRLATIAAGEQLSTDRWVEESTDR